MGFKLEKEKTGSTPYILIDEDNSYMKFEGKSFHENVFEFYSETIKWLDEYLATDFDTFTFESNLIYFNSSTAKLLLNMLKDMDKAAAAGKKVIVNWVTTEDNDILIEYAEDFQELLDHLEFNLIFN